MNFSDDSLSPALAPAIKFLKCRWTREQGSAYDVACESCPAEGNNCTLSSRNEVQLCEPVLEHTSSPNSNDTLASLSLHPGYWRSSNSSRDIRECYEPDACHEGLHGSCSSGYEGPCECTYGRDTHYNRS